MKEKIAIGLVDDYVMLRRGLADTIERLGYEVVYQASSGLQLIKEFGLQPVMPQVIFLDIQMPGKNGFDTAAWITENYPQVLILALSMYDDEASIIKMLRNGVKGYVLKDNEPSVLKAAIDAVCNNGFYYSELVTGKIIRSIAVKDANHILSARHIEFLNYACTEMTYKEIAHRMKLSPRTIDGYRDELFERLEVKSRIGLVLYALKNRVVVMAGKEFVA